MSSTNTFTTSANDLILFKTICADFEDILPQDFHGSFSQQLQIPYLGLITRPQSPSSSSSSFTSSTPNDPFRYHHPHQHPQYPSFPCTPSFPLIAHEKFVKGIVWGASLRPIISLSVQITDSILSLSGTRFPIHVHFLYLPASPQTYLSKEVLHTLGIEDMVIVGEHSIDPLTNPLDPITAVPEPLNISFRPSQGSLSNTMDVSADSAVDGCLEGTDNDERLYHTVKSYSSTLLRLPLRINGYVTMVARSPSDGHFSHLNILGQDFVQLSKANVFFGGQIPRFEISFP